MAVVFAVAIGMIAGPFLLSFVSGFIDGFGKTKFSDILVEPLNKTYKWAKNLARRFHYSGRRFHRGG